MRPASIESRFFASLIDGLVAILILVPIFTAPLYFYLDNACPGGETACYDISMKKVDYTFGFFASLLMILYFSIFTAMTKLKTTPGRSWMKIRVVDVNGDELTFLHAAWRALVVQLLLPIAIIDLIVALFDEKRRTVHDLIGKTIVVSAISIEN